MLVPKSIGSDPCIGGIGSTALVGVSVLLICALTVQKAARNNIGMRCCIFITVSIQGQRIELLPGLAMNLCFTFPTSSRPIQNVPFLKGLIPYPTSV